MIGVVLPLNSKYKFSLIRSEFSTCIYVKIATLNSPRFYASTIVKTNIKIVKKNVTQQDKILEKILSGTSDTDIPFAQLWQLLYRLGFDERIRGDHRIFIKADVEEILNLQHKKGKAKSYQIKQVRAVILKYKLGIKNDVSL